MEHNGFHRQRHYFMADGSGYKAVVVQWFYSIDAGQHPCAGFIQHIYQTIPNVNFSSDICAPLAKRLRVLEVPNAGWSGWGLLPVSCAR